MKKFFIKKIFPSILLLTLIGGGLFYYQTAQGVNRTWDGGGTDGTCGGSAGDGNKWACAANWSGDTAPTASDVAIFDGTSTKDATIAANISVAGISINAGYTGTITQSGSFTVTVGSSHYSQADGTFTGGSGAITINGTYTLSGGTFTSTSGILSVGRAAAFETFFTISGGTFNHNNGTVTFIESWNGNCDDAKTVDIATTLTLYNVDINSPLNDCIRLASGDTITATNNFSITKGSIAGSGAWEVQGDITIGSSAVTVFNNTQATLTYTGTGAKTYTYGSGGNGPHLRVNTVSGSLTANGGTTSLSVDNFSLINGTFTAPSGTMTVGRFYHNETFFTVSGGTFNHNNGTVKFDQYYNGNCNDIKTIDVVTSLTLYDIVVDTSSFSSDCIRVASGDTLIASNNFTQTSGAIIGNWEVQGNYTVGISAGGGTAGITFTGGNAQIYTDNGGNESDGDVLVSKSSNTVTLASNADWNATSQDVTVTSGTLASSTFNIATTNFTVNGGTFTGGSGTVTTSGPMAVSSGTFTGGVGNIDVNNTFTLSGGTFTSTSGTLEVGRASVSSETFLTVSSGTFNHNNGTTRFAPTANCTSATFTVNVATSLSLYDVIVNAPGNCSAVATVAAGSGDTIIANHDFTQTDGILTGTWEVQNNVTIGSTADGGAGTVTYTTTGAHTYAYTVGGLGPHLRVNHASATVSAFGGTTALSVSLFSLLAGTFTAPTGTMTVGQVSGSSETVFTVASGATFAHNSGTVQFSSTANCSNITATVDVDTSLSLYDVTINSTGFCSANTTVATGAGDTVVVTRNFTHTNGLLNNTWEVQGNYTVGAGADAGTAGIRFTGGNAQVYTDNGGNEPDGDVIINKTPGSSVRLASNADWNAASQDVTITSGELNMGASYNLSTTALTISTAGHLSNNGTGDLTLAGNVSNSGNIRFMSSGACGGSDSISITSSTGGVQRTWSGTGTYLFHDVTVQDQGGSATITAYSSTSTSGNGVNWTFSGAACPAQAPSTGLSTGKWNVTTGKLNLR